MTKQIPLTKNKYALVDDEDYEKVMQYNWYARKYENVFYAFRPERLLRKAGINKRITIRMHRFILDAPKGAVIDHINGNGLDNRKSNLRFVTNHQNCLNRSVNKSNSTGYKGVHRYRSGQFAAQIQYNKVKMFLGYHDTPEQAARAYDEKARELFGEYARLNFPS